MNEINNSSDHRVAFADHRVVVDVLAVIRVSFLVT